MRALLDTSVLVGRAAPPDDVEAAVSVVSITELYFGILITDDEEERANRLDRLTSVLAAFDPLPVTIDVARAWGHLAATVARRGSKPRRRQIDLAIAATALTEEVPLFTYNDADLRMVADLVDVRRPAW